MQGFLMILLVGSLADAPVADFHIGAFHRNPGCAIRDLLLTRIARLSRKGAVESLAVDILGLGRQVTLYRGGRSAFVRYGIGSSEGVSP